MASAHDARAAIDSVMRSRGLYDKARAVLRDSSTKINAGDDTRGDIFDALRHAGLVDDLLLGVKEAGITLDASTLQLLQGGSAPASARISIEAPGTSERTRRIAASAPAVSAPLPDEASHDADLDPTRRYLRVHAGRGRAFLAHLDDAYVEEHEEEDGGRQGSVKTPQLRRFYVLHLLACGSRWHSSPIPATTDPDFGQCGDLLVDITPTGTGPLPPPVSLLGLSDTESRVHIVVTLITQRPRPIEPGLDAVSEAVGRGSAGDLVADVVGLHTVDWRAAMAELGGKLSTLLHVPAVGPGPHGPLMPTTAPAPAGLLALTLEMVPSLGGDNHDSDTTIQDAASAAVRSSAGRATDASRTFFTYAKAWWAEYKGLHPSFRFRPVRIFGEAETGEHLPAVTFVSPLQTDRSIDSPAAAARFVSLLSYRTPDSAIGGSLGARAAWRALHSTLAARGGDTAAHALLLASLLLGFGLDAYAVVGTRADPSGSEEESMWVMTRYPLPGSGHEDVTSRSRSPRAGSPSRPSDTTEASLAGPGYRAVFWDPLTGGRSAPGDVLPSGHLFCRVACAFSHNRFYACTAGDDTAGSVSWAFNSPLGVDWKAMDGGMLESLAPLRTCPPPVAGPTLDGAGLGMALESVLKAAIARYRQLPRIVARIAAGSSKVSGSSAASCPWDDVLGYLLSQALAAYETERMHSVTTGVDDFAVAVKRSVPRGHAFRGFPILFNHASPARMLDALLAAPAARDILETPCVANTAFALRVAVHVHAEDCTATWLMLAVRMPLN